jgi:hypothetical protein
MPPVRKVTAIVDRYLVGFGQCARSRVVRNGSAVYLEYKSGWSYIVPLSYILKWWAHQPKSTAGRRILRSRRVSDDHVVRLYLSDGGARDLVFDAVLMACEPRYEHFGGLKSRTAAARPLIKRYWRQFRVKPSVLEVPIGSLPSWLLRRAPRKIGRAPGATRRRRES